jgi:hypothetical protein
MNEKKCSAVVLRSAIVCIPGPRAAGGRFLAAAAAGRFLAAAGGRFLAASAPGRATGLTQGRRGGAEAQGGGEAPVVRDGPRRGVAGETLSGLRLHLPAPARQPAQSLISLRRMGG